MSNVTVSQLAEVLGVDVSKKEITGVSAGKSRQI